MGTVGLNLPRLRALAKDLDSASQGAPALHRAIGAVLEDAQGALGPDKPATKSPQLAHIQHTGTAGIGVLKPTAPVGFGAGPPGSLQAELSAMASDLRRRCNKAEDARKKHGFGQGITPVDAFNGVTPHPKPKPKKKGWFQKYIGDPVKHGIEDAGHFVASVFTWKNVLDAGSMVLGAFLMAAGAGVEVGGVALDATGVGALVGVPANIAGVAVFGLGTSLAVAGAGDFMYRMSNGDMDGAWNRSGHSGSGGDPPPKEVTPEEEQAFTKSQEDLSGLSKSKARQQVAKGVEKDGIRYKPETKLLKSGKHGLDWKEALARAKKEGKPQGRFGSEADVHFATQKGSELGPGNSGFFRLPKGNTCEEVMPDGTTRKPDTLFVKVRSDGTVHAYPLTR